MTIKAINRVNKFYRTGATGEIRANHPVTVRSLIRRPFVDLRQISHSHEPCQRKVLNGIRPGSLLHLIPRQPTAIFFFLSPSEIQ